VQQKQMAEAATAQLREALQQEQQKTAALTQEAKAGQAMTTAADPERRAIEDAQAHAAALASELAGMRREIKTQAAQSQKAVDEAVRQKQTADAASTQLREALQQEQQKTAALTQEAKTAQADPERRALEDAQAHAAALASELAGMRREIETQAAQSQKAVDEAVQAATAQLRETLQQEQQKTAALTQEASAAHKATTAAEQERRSAESTIADLPSPPQEHQRAEMLSSEVRRKLKALATLSRQGSGKTASNRAAEDAKSELKPSLRQKRGQPKEITPSAESTRQSAGTAATEQRPVSIDANASEANGLLARAKALVVQGNILAARTVLERAAETGSAQATFALAETYDPNVLATWKTRGTRGDATRARDLYARAYEGGIKTAKDRSDSLVIGNGERPASWFGREEADH
jgi:hypothetical protein